MTSTLSLVDRWKRWSYLQDVELWLDPMPRKRRREVLRDLRTNLEDASADVGMTAAIADLGKPRALAREYLDSEPSPRPWWTMGVVGAGAVLLVAILAGEAYMFGMTDALFSSGGSTGSGSFLGIEIMAVATDEEISWTLHGFSWPILVAAVLAFAVCSRSWRVLQRRASSPTGARREVADGDR